MKRLNAICAQIEKCGVFADIGCDHGFVSKYVLDNNLCEKAIISDISKKSLEKAEKLLDGHIKSGKVKAYCTDGLNGIKEKIDIAVIAGMGGQEIISILKNTENLPKKIILQPMNNAPKLREFLKDYFFIDKDFLIKEGGRYYDIISGEKGRGNLTENEILFGKTNLKEKNPEFLKKITVEIENYEKYITKAKDSDSEKNLKDRLEKLKEVIK